MPSGVGRGGERHSREEILEVLKKGSEWALENNMATKEDLERTEEYGNMKAEPHAVSERALQRGIPQLGTLGAGNHFLEIQKVDQIFNEEIAKNFGIDEQGQITVMIHCGSRGLGHQVASDYIKKMEEKYTNMDIELFSEKDLVNAKYSLKQRRKIFDIIELEFGEIIKKINDYKLM